MGLADACEAAKIKEPADSGWPEEPEDIYLRLQSLRQHESKCVASDDPRLKGKIVAQYKCEFDGCEQIGKLHTFMDNTNNRKLNISLCGKHDQLLQDFEKIALARSKIVS